jgi:hypothetical protein
MWRLTAALPLLALLVTAPSACRMKRKDSVKMSQDDAQLATAVTTADPRTAVQLVRGFHGVENQSWRWTMKNFTVTLRPPSGADKGGARLEMKFVIPEVMYNRVGDQTLSAKVNGVDLGSEKYSKAGEFTYSRDVPASALSGDAVSFDFSVDKGIPPSDQDPRELAVVVTSVGLFRK